jgi:hypothetical protein
MERKAMLPEEKAAARRRYFDWTWAHGLTALKQFRTREGHCRVPRHYIEGAYRLGQWVAVQRYYHIKGILASNRKIQLDKLGFVWSRRDWLWENGFVALKAFKGREGHCRVGAHHFEGAFKLGLWVSTQRRNKSKMSKERKGRLNDIGFVWTASCPEKSKAGPYIFEQPDVSVPALGR